MNVIPGKRGADTTVVIISGKSRALAAMLAVLAGIFGAHRFYVGKLGTGAIWLCTLGLAGIGMLFDLVMILCGRFTDAGGAILRDW